MEDKYFKDCVTRMPIWLFVPGKKPEFLNLAPICTDEEQTLLEIAVPGHGFRFPIGTPAIDAPKFNYPEVGGDAVIDAILGFPSPALGIIVQLSPDVAHSNVCISNPALSVGRETDTYYSFFVIHGNGGYLSWRFPNEERNVTIASTAGKVRVLNSRILTNVPMGPPKKSPSEPAPDDCTLHCDVEKGVAIAIGPPLAILELDCPKPEILDGTLPLELMFDRQGIEKERIHTSGSTHIVGVSSSADKVTHALLASDEPEGRVRYMVHPEATDHFGAAAAKVRAAGLL